MNNGVFIFFELFCIIVDGIFGNTFVDFFNILSYFLVYANIKKTSQTTLKTSFLSFNQIQN